MGDRFNISARDAIIQPFIPEIALGEVSLFYFGDSYSHAVIKKAPPNDFRSHPIWGASVEPYSPSRDELQMCKHMFDVVDPVEYARVDLVNTSKGPMLIELELIEPFMFFDMFPDRAKKYVDHIENYLNR